jgi:hypothetical protein
LREWTESETVWLDELYDLTDRFPDPASMRLILLNGQPLPHSAKDKDKHTGRLILKGMTTPDTRGTLDVLISRLMQEPYYRVDRSVSQRNTGTAGRDRQLFPRQFETTIDIAKRPASGYVRRLSERSNRQGRQGQDPAGNWDGDLGFEEGR